MNHIVAITVQARRSVLCLVVFLVSTGSTATQAYSDDVVSIYYPVHANLLNEGSMVSANGSTSATGFYYLKVSIDYGYEFEEYPFTKNILEKASVNYNYSHWYCGFKVLRDRAKEATAGHYYLLVTVEAFNMNGQLISKGSDLAELQIPFTPSP